MMFHRKTQGFAYISEEFPDTDEVLHRTCSCFLGREFLRDSRGGGRFVTWNRTGEISLPRGIEA
jgi:hypothetical protein